MFTVQQVQAGVLLRLTPTVGQLFRTHNRVERESELWILVTPTLLGGTK